MPVTNVKCAPTRRRFIGGGAAAAVTTAATPLEAAFPKVRPVPRPAPGEIAPHLVLDNLHTGETIAVTYRQRDGYDRSALMMLNHLLRDWRQDEVQPIDPKLFDLMAGIALRIGAMPRYGIASGYRTPQTNAMLRRNGQGAAKHSLHMSGQAIDLHLDGVGLAELRHVAMELEMGGVGYYPGAGFVHIDTGEVRSWTG